jgi:DNA ligase-1
MNSDQVFDAIEQIAATPGKKDKELLVGELLKDELGKRVLVAAYDPFVTFGIAKAPERTAPGAGYFDQGGDTFALLDKLATRELTGNAAKAAVQTEVDRLSEPSSQLFKRILTKDMRAGFTEGTINRAAPGTITVFDVMLAHPFKDHKHKVTYPVAVEPKLDGVRVVAFADIGNKSVRFFSRSGKEFTSFDLLKEPVMLAAMNFAIKLSPPFDPVIVFDGEVVSGNFNKTVGDVRRKDEQMTDAKFCVFEAMTRAEFNDVNSKDECHTVGWHVDRRRRLEATIPDAGPGKVVFRLPSFQAVDEEGVYHLYNGMRDRGLEGIIVKSHQTFYAKKRSVAWLKVKGEESADLKVTGAFEGEGKYVGMLGGLYVDRNGVQVAVGGGFSDDQRVEFWAAFRSEQEHGPACSDGGEIVGRTIEVVYHEVTPDGSLRHPRFKRFRDDKAGVTA